MNFQRLISAFVTAMILGACAQKLPDITANLSSTGGVDSQGQPITPSSLQVSPQQVTVQGNQVVNFSVSGGTPPYTFTRTQGPGTVDPSTGIFTAGLLGGTAVIEIKDFNGVVTTALVSIDETYRWVTGAYGACSKTCGGGTQSRAVICANKAGAQVADTLCVQSNAGAKPAASQACNTQACPPVTINTFTNKSCGGQLCSCGVAFQNGVPNPTAAAAICKNLGKGSLVSFQTTLGPLGVIQCGAGGSGCFVNQFAGNLVCTTVTCQP